MHADAAARTRQLSARLRRRVMRARKTGNARQFELMLALRPERPAVIAEGDSWFAYPPAGLVFGDSRSNIVNWLVRRARLNLLQLSASGDEAVHMLTGPSKHRLIDLLERFPIDFLLFSGGGNDLVGRHDFAFMLRQVKGDRDDFRAYLQHERIDRRLGLIEAVYRELIDFCDEYSRNPALRIVTHCYDYALPSPRGARFIGGLVRPDGGRSWLLPALRKKRVPPHHHAAIARHLIDQLAERLLRLALARPDRLTVVDTRGTVEPAEWLNEIHPDTQGFRRLSQRILDQMRASDARV